MTARRCCTLLALALGCAPARLALVVHAPPELTSSFGADFEALHGADVAACLGAARAADPERIGRVVVNFAIQRDGTATLATVARNTTGDETLATCVLDVVTGVRFQPQPTTRVVSYPFFLEPPGRPTYPPAEFVVGPADGSEKAPEAEQLERESAADLIGCLERMPIAVPWLYLDVHTSLAVNTGGSVIGGGGETEAPLPGDSLAYCLGLRIKLRQYPASEFVWAAEIPVTLLEARADSYGPNCAWPGRIPAWPRNPARCEVWRAGQDVSTCDSEAECVERCGLGCWEACSWVGAVGFGGEDDESWLRVLRRACEASGDACLELGYWLHSKGRTDEADAVLAPLCDEGFWGTACGLLAQIRAESGRSPEAEIPGCRACTVSPWLCGPLGVSLRDTGRILEAEVALDAACQVDTMWDDISPCVAYADLLAERGLFEEASAVFLDDEPETQDDTAAHCPAGAVCDTFSFPQSTRHNHAARYALLGGRPEEAEQLVRDHEYDRECRVTLAAALLAQGRRDEALATYREELDGHPELGYAVEESLDLVASAYPELVATVEEVRQALGVQATSTEVDGDATPDAATLGDHGAPAGAEEAR